LADEVEAIVLWLLVVNLGVAFGAGIYESRFEVPRWRHLPPREWTNTGTKFWAFVTTGPLTLLTVASLVLVWGADGARQGWWLVATALLVIERLTTFGYFIPTIARVQSSSGLSPAEVNTTLSRWMTLNLGRHLLDLAAWLTSLAAFSTIGD
jgi:Domain of unknown function (DUF1772)